MSKVGLGMKSGGAGGRFRVRRKVACSAGFRFSSVGSV